MDAGADRLDADIGGVNDLQEGMDRPVRLSVMSKRSDFLAANRGLRVSRPGFVLLAFPNGTGAMRFGITVTKRIGNAVVRNRMKRRFRELLRAVLPTHGLPAHDHVLIGREGGIERDFTALHNELRAALGRAAAGKGDPPRHRPGGPGKGGAGKGGAGKGGSGQGGSPHRTRGKGGGSGKGSPTPSAPVA